MATQQNPNETILGSKFDDPNTFNIRPVKLNPKLNPKLNQKVFNSEDAAWEYYEQLRTKKLKAAQQTLDASIATALATHSGVKHFWDGDLGTKWFSDIYGLNSVAILASDKSDETA